MDGLQGQASTLKRLNHPSDDPAAATKVLELRSEKVTTDQFHMNAQLAEHMLSNADSALSEFVDIVLRAKDIALRQAGLSNGDESNMGVSEEVASLHDQAIAVANVRVGDRYLFGGYQVTKPPVDVDGNYHGDQGQAYVDVGPSVRLAINVPGPQIWDVGEDVNLFQELSHLKISLAVGDQLSTRGSLDRLDALHAHLVAMRAKLGSRLAGIGAAAQTLDRHVATNIQLISKLEDADIAQVVTELGKQEALFKSSLATSKRLIQPTLLDFLR